jgi:cbb3-type cytochrome oxidase maturation protein
MSVLYVALPAALLLGGAAMLACVASIRRGQFDDLETPAVRILIDERPIGDASDKARERGDGSDTA